LYSFTEGVVVAIIPEGFRIANSWGNAQEIRTMTPGSELDLAIGDHVVVHGGPMPDGAFATSTISKRLPSGEEIEIPDRPKLRDRPPAAERPADFAVYYEDYSAPLPPPHSWQHHLWIGPGPEAVVEVIPGDRSPGNPVWTERFQLDGAHLDWLHGVLRDQGAFDREWSPSRDISVGGGSAALTIVAGGRQVNIPPYVAADRRAGAAAMFAAARALIPPDAWERLTARRAAHVAKLAR
jgi:hypothetical protein